ncbi:MAG: hypothetical protein JSR46_06355, partial [Verrucomicrobia bacterium]|nr:hypothetical protein [Verrucomicrobiota bacterium]
LLQHDEKKQKIGIDMWQASLRYATTHYVQEFIFLGDELGKIATKKKQDTILLYFLNAVCHLYADNIIPDDVAFNFFNRFYLINDEPSEMEKEIARGLMIDSFDTVVDNPLSIAEMLSATTLSSQEKIALIESSIELLRPLPNDLKEQIRASHVRLYNQVCDDDALAVSLLMALLKIFKPTELYQKSIAIWLRILKQLDSVENIEPLELLKLKENILFHIVEDRSIFRQCRPAVHELMNDYLNAGAIEAVLTLSLHFEQLETPHAYSELELSNLYRCIAIFQAEEDHENVLRLLRTAKKNERFRDDAHFTRYAAQYMMSLLERKEYQKWIFLLQEFKIHDTSQQFYTACEEAIFNCLDMSTTCLRSIFSLLEETMHPNALLWSTFFHAVNVSNQKLLKLNVSTLVTQEERFPGLWKVETNALSSCLIQLLQIAADVPNFDTDKCIKKIIPLLPTLVFENRDAQWSLYKLLITVCSTSTAYDLMLASASMIHTSIYNPEFSHVLPEALPYISQLLKTWPKVAPQTVDKLLPTELTAPKLLHDIALALKSSSDGTFFDEYENLILNRSETLQLAALKLYKWTMLTMFQKVPDNGIPQYLASGKFKTKLLKSAFQSKYPDVIREALIIFNGRIFQECILYGALLPFCDFIIQHLIKIPIETYAQQTTYEHLCTFFLTYAKEAQETTRKTPARYFKYFIEANNKLLALSGNIDLFSKNHYDMFSHVARLAEENKLDLTISAKDELLPHLSLLQSCCTAIFQGSPHKKTLAIIACQELALLLESMPDTRSRATCIKYIEFIPSVIYMNDRCLFTELYGQCPDIATATSIEYLKTMGFVINTLENSNNIIKYLIHAVKNDFLSGVFIAEASEISQLEYYRNLFFAVEFLENYKLDPAPIYMLFLGKIVALEPTTQAQRQQLHDFLYAVANHYFHLCSTNRNATLVTKHLLPPILRRLDELNNNG